MSEMKIEELFESIKPIIIKNKEARAKKEEKGDFFNIFSVLNMETDEVNTHSAFLAELLNPKGSHGLKDGFLRLFVEIMPLQNVDKDSLQTDSAIIKKEEYIGKKDVKKETGGDIDILIKFQNPQYTIIIENKINAGDQEAQLARYHNYAKQFGNSFTLFYLTKDGHEPSEWSTGKDTKKHYWRSISYVDDLDEWLNKCLEISKRFPFVNNCIKQYKNLILKLAGRNLEEGMDEKILKQMLNHNEEVLAIWENWENWEYSIVEKVMKEVAEATDCKCERYDNNNPWFIWTSGCWIGFIPNEYKNCKIGFGKDANDSPYYYLEKKDISTAQPQLECMEYKSTKETPYGYNYLDSKYLKWGLNVAKAIQNGDFKKYLIQCIDDILNDPNFPK